MVVKQSTREDFLKEMLRSGIERYMPIASGSFKSIDIRENYVIGKVYGLDRPEPKNGKPVEYEPYHAIMDAETQHVSLHQNDWFDRLVEGNWTKHILPFAGKIEAYMEIGVCEGRSMRWVMEHLHPAYAMGIDPYEPGRERQAVVFKRYREFAVKNLEPWKDRIEMVKARSHEFLRTDGAPFDQSFDMIYVDGDHRGQFCMTDLVLSWWKLRIDGIMVIDDFNARWRHSQPATWEAASGFILAFDHLFDYLYRTRKQVAIIKRKHG